jgi:hypothetical protein
MGLNEASEDEDGMEADEADVEAGELVHDASDQDVSVSTDDVESPLISPSSRTSPEVTSGGSCHLPPFPTSGEPVCEGQEDQQGLEDSGAKGKTTPMLTTTSMGVAKKHEFEAEGTKCRDIMELRQV